jgi:drug/metabolite transporter (DMT)-like permease
MVSATEEMQHFRSTFAFMNLKNTEEKAGTESALAASESTINPSATTTIESKYGDFYWKLVVGGICFLWGTNFATIRQIFIELPELDPAVYASWRFGIATIPFIPSFVSRLGDMKLLKNTFLCGFFVFIGYMGQAIGLANGSTPEKSAFIAAMCVVWVPFLQSCLSGDWTKQKWLSTVLAITGIGLLELVGSSPPNTGDLWSLLQPVGFGSSYLLIEYCNRELEATRRQRLDREEHDLDLGNGEGEETDVARAPSVLITPDRRSARAEEAEKADAAASTGLQIFFIAIMSGLYAISRGNTTDDFLAPLQSITATGNLLYTGLVTTAAAIYAQTIVSTKVKSTDIAIILAAEPVFATACAAWLLHETVSSLDVIGGGLIILSCLAAEIDLTKLFVNREKQEL